MLLDLQGSTHVQAIAKLKNLESKSWLIISVAHFYFERAEPEVDLTTPSFDLYIP